MTWSSVFQHTYNTSVLLLFIEFQMKTNSSFLCWRLLQWNKQIINPQVCLDLKFWFVQISSEQSGILFPPPLLFLSPKTDSSHRLYSLGTGRDQICDVPGSTLARGQEKQKLNCFACWTSEHFEINFDSLSFQEKQSRLWDFFFFLMEGKIFTLFVPLCIWKSQKKLVGVSKS